jgi:hypothetical protein
MLDDGAELEAIGKFTSGDSVIRYIFDIPARNAIRTSSELHSNIKNLGGGYITDMLNHMKEIKGFVASQPLYRSKVTFLDTAITKVEGYLQEYHNLADIKPDAKVTVREIKENPRVKIANEILNTFFPTIKNNLVCSVTTGGVSLKLSKGTKGEDVRDALNSGLSEMRKPSDKYSNGLNKNVFTSIYQSAQQLVATGIRK